MIIPSDLGQVIGQARERSGLKQKELADRLEIDPSKVSRIERGDIRLESKEILKIISFLSADVGGRLRNYLEQDWIHLARPSPWHPEYDALWVAEQHLQQLQALDVQEHFPVVLRPQITSLREDLLKTGTFLESLDHNLAFIGGIGKGKTTALCLVAGLVVPDPSSPAFENVALETGGGRITLCEVQVRSGPEYGIIIEPLSEREVYSLVDDFCAGLVARQQGATGTEADVGVSSEIEKAIRNMSDLATKPAPKGSGGKRIDPAVDLLSVTTSPQELRSEIAKRMTLWRRTERETFYKHDSKISGIEWIKGTFRLINKGRHPGFSIPRRVTILVPDELLKGSGYSITVVDTKGIDESPNRADIKDQVENNRTVCILCSSFNDAPDADVKGVIEQAMEGGSDAIQRDRFVLLVLPWAGQAQKVTDESGERPETEEEGYEIKREQIRNALMRLRADGVPTVFFNSASDKSLSVRQAFVEQVRKIRRNHVLRIGTLSNTVQHLIEHQNEERLRESQRLVVERLTRFAKRHDKLPDRIVPAHDRLIEAFDEVGARSIWASTRRNGEWYNFSVYVYLGIGTQIDAKLRSQQAVDGLVELIDDMMTDPKTEGTSKFLRTVRDNVGGWHQDFLSDARHVGEETFKPTLAEDSKIWADCLNRWGQGSGYRADVARMIKDWFNHSDRAGLRAALENRIRAAWRTNFIGPIRRICENTEPEKTGTN